MLSHSNNPRSPTFIACAFFALFIVYAILTGRCLYADGSYYFLRMLETGNFAAIIGCRSFAAYLFDLPVVIALHLGINNIHWLTFAFGIGCFSAWPLAMLACYRMAPSHFWLVILACAAGYLNACFVAVGEHFVAHAFFWPALFAILFVRPLTPFAALNLLVSAIILMRSYESMLFLGPPLMALVLWRMVHDKENLWRQSVLAAASMFLLIATYIAWIGVKYPNPANYGGFKNAFFFELHYPAWTVKMTSYWAILMLASLYPPCAKFLRQRVGLLLTILAALVWGTMPILAPEHLNPSSQYECRFLDLLVPLLLMPVAVLLALKPNWLAARLSDLTRLSAMMLIAQSLWHLSATYQWEIYINSWKKMLATQSGPIFLLADHTFNASCFAWANPSVSLMIGPSQVQALIMPDHVESWQPFDPLQPNSLPDLKRYGVDYSNYIKALNRKNSPVKEIPPPTN